MRITCPCCGERDLGEFSYLGDAGTERPDPASPEATRQFFEYVYLRPNPAGPHEEFWYHGAGCRSWLIVSRDTLTHQIFWVVRAADRCAGAST
jgi:heterotetrameric sarcosine oxidase delta subunit